MSNESSAVSGTSTYAKVPAHPGLYRHSRSGRYYGFKKLNGRRHECSLRTTDRKIAERRLKDWIRNLVAGGETNTGFCVPSAEIYVPAP